MCGTQEELDYLMIDDLMFDMIRGSGGQEELVGSSGRNEGGGGGSGGVKPPQMCKKVCKF